MVVILVELLAAFTFAAAVAALVKSVRGDYFNRLGIQLVIVLLVVGFAGSGVLWAFYGNQVWTYVPTLITSFALIWLAWWCDPEYEIKRLARRLEKRMKLKEE